MADVDVRKRPGGQFHQGFCSAPHPEDPDVWCRRLPHPGDDTHSAFRFSIITPETWQEGPQF